MAPFLITKKAAMRWRKHWATTMTSLTGVTGEAVAMFYMLLNLDCATSSSAKSPSQVGSHQVGAFVVDVEGFGDANVQMICGGSFYSPVAGTVKASANNPGEFL